MRAWLVSIVALTLSACAPDYVPRDKNATVDPQTGQAIMPYPCPDWSHNATINWDNSVHSNYGCAVNNNLAVQLVDPRDLERGRGGSLGDSEASTRVLQQYRAGETPAALNPIQGGNGQ